jgi:hypothetical protein
MAHPPVRPLLLLLALGGLALLALPRTSHAQIHRCTTADGGSLYTDQKCEALGATDRPPDPAPAPNTGPKALGATGTRLYRGGCSRTLQDLVFEITSAIDAQDANRLSGVYHWVGMPDDAANAVMDRLDAIVQRPLVDISPLSAEPAADATIVAGPAEVPRTTVRRPPTGLRLDQVTANGARPTQTVLGLRRHFGCWWISL